MAPGSGTDERPLRRRRSRLARVATLLLGQSTQNLTLATLALLLPLIRQDIEMTFTQAGTLSVATTLTYALGQIPAGYLGDRYGPRRVMLFGLVGLNAATVLIAAATTFTFLLIVFTVVGALRALVFPPGLTLITAEFAESRRASAMSMFMAAGFGSSLLVSIFAPPLVDPLGWQGTFALFGLVSLLTVAAYWFASRTGGPVIRKATSAADSPVRALLGQPIVWLASIVQFTRLAVTMALRFWLPTYLITDKGFSLGAVALVVALGSALSVTFTLVGGHISDRLDRPVLVIGTSLSALLAGLALLTVVDDLAVVVVVTAVLYMFVQAYSGPLFEVPLRLLGSTRAGTLNGFGNFWANVGGLVAGLMLGIAKDATGSFDVGWLALSGLCLVALVTTFLMHLEMRRVRSHEDVVQSIPNIRSRE